MTMIQDLHAAISRRDWHAVEVAANRLRDADLEKHLTLKIEECASLANSLDGYEADNAALTDRVKEYVDARDAYERATLSNGGFGQPRTLKHNDPIVLRYREARAALEAKP